MIYRVDHLEDGGKVFFDETGVHTFDAAGDLVFERALDATEQSIHDRFNAIRLAEIARSTAIDDVRAGLQNAVDLMALHPFPTPEEQAVVDATVEAALALYRELAEPPADTVATAASLLSTKVV